MDLLTNYSTSFWFFSSSGKAGRSHFKEWNLGVPSAPEISRDIFFVVLYKFYSLRVWIFFSFIPYDFVWGFFSFILCEFGGFCCFIPYEFVWFWFFLVLFSMPLIFYFYSLRVWFSTLIFQQLPRKLLLINFIFHFLLVLQAWKKTQFLNLISFPILIFCSSEGVGDTLGEGTLLSPGWATPVSVSGLWVPTGGHLSATKFGFLFHVIRLISHIYIMGVTAVF